jgi:hypothetical protein
MCQNALISGLRLHQNFHPSMVDFLQSSSDSTRGPVDYAFCDKLLTLLCLHTLICEYNFSPWPYTGIHGSFKHIEAQLKPKFDFLHGQTLQHMRFWPSYKQQKHWYQTSYTNAQSESTVVSLSLYVLTIRAAYSLDGCLHILSSKVAR